MSKSPHATLAARLLHPSEDTGRPTMQPVSLSRAGAPTLLQLQAEVTRALLQDDNAAAHAVRADGLQPEARLAIYRHHVFTTLTETLKAAYPVVCRLVDERFFAYAAHYYIRQYPPTGPCLFEYGASLAHFLADFPPCRALAYLPDVARLEWAMHAVWYADDVPPLSLACLQEVLPDVLGDLTCTFVPAVAYVRSPWPIDQIWQANQPGADPQTMLRLEPTATHLEIYRGDDDVVFRHLAAGHGLFRASLAEHQSLGQAFEAALAVDPDFCLTTALQTLFADGLVSHVTLTGAEKESKSWQ